MDTTDLEIVAQALRAGWDRRPFSGECFDALERIQDRISELEIWLPVDAMVVGVSKARVDYS